MGIVNRKEADNRDTGAGSGLLNRFTALLAIAFSLFHLYIAGIGIMSMSAARHIHLILSMVLIFLIYPLSKKNLAAGLFILISY